MPYGASGAEFTVNTTTPRSQTQSDTGQLANGNVIVVWLDATLGTSANQFVKGQIYGPNGEPLGVELNLAAGGVNPSVAGLPNGGFVLTWQTFGAFKAQLFNADGTAGGSAFTVTPQNVSPQNADVAALPNGGFAIAWEDTRTTGGDISGTGIHVHAYDQFGNPFPEAQVNISTNRNQGDAAIAGLSDGRYVMTWTDRGGSPWLIKGRFVDANGVPQGSEFVIPGTSSAVESSITALSNGSFAVAWYDSGHHVQIFNASGSPIGGVFTTPASLTGIQVGPEIVALAEGGFAISWTTNAGPLSDGAGTAIYVQVLDPNAQAIGDPMRANTQTIGDQVDSQLVALSGGGFMVTWTDFNGAGGDDDQIKAQIFRSADPVSITSGGGGDQAAFTINEHDIYATQITAEAGGSSAGIHYAITGGDDAALFRIDPSTGLLGFATAPDYEAPASADGDNSYEVWVQADNGVFRDTQLVTVSVLNVNERPVIVSDGGGTSASFTLPENSTLVTTVVGSDPDGDQILYRIVPNNNDFALFTIDGATGVLTFIAPPDYEAPSDFGTDNFYRVTVEVSDGTPGWSAFQTIEILVTNVNEAPDLTGEQTVLANGTEDVGYTVTGTQLLDGFTDVDGDVLSVANLSANHGNIVDNGDGSFTITQAANFNGSVTLSYDVVDGNGDSVAGTISYDVAAVNDAPALSGSQAVLADGTEDSAYTVAAAQLLAGFSDVDGDILSIANLAADHATVADNGDGTYTITPATNFNGSVTLSYSVIDGHGGSAAGSLGYTLGAVNDAPALTGSQAMLANAAEDAAYTVTAAELLTGFTDADGDTLSIVGLSADQGTVVDNGNGSYTITQAPNFNGAVTLGYSVVDGNGGSVAASLGYTVDAVNDAPALTGQQTALGSGTEDVAYTVTAAQLTGGYSDVEGDALSIANLSADHGTVTSNGDGTYTIRQAANFNGGVALSYDVVDGHGGSVAATLAYVIDGVNDAPVLTGNAAALSAGNEDVAYTVTRAQLTTGYTDVDGDSLSVTNLSADHGSVVDNGDGTYTVTQSANFNGAVRLSYNVIDGHGGSASAQASYVLSPVNDGPIGSVTISGTAATGLQLTASNTLADADGLGAINYQWLLDGTAISGATGSSYVVRSGDLGHTISAVASYTDLGGTAEHVTSAATSAVVQGPGTFTGTGGNDTLSGSNFDDTLNGLAGNDVLRGLAGNDVLNGGAGNDLLDGGAGIDTASYADATAGVKISLAIAGAQNIGGGSGSDTLTAIENLVGSNYNDTLTGDAGANRLDGNGGGDTLTGGAGADTFVFDVLTTSGNKDSVKDFVSGTDRIELSTSAFAGLAGYGLGQLSAGELVFGTKALTANDHLIYDSKTGNLIYDADGSGAGATVTIATLTNHPTIQAGDIFLT